MVGPRPITLAMCATLINATLNEKGVCAHDLFHLSPKKVDGWKNREIRNIEQKGPHMRCIKKIAQAKLSSDALSL